MNLNLDLQEGEKAGQEAKGTPERFEVSYALFSINGKMLGSGEPIRVKQGERVLFHVLNASATETRSLALPGHVFRVVALDGNPVPTPADVPVLWLGTAERISAIVEMNHPGVFILGDLSDDDRGHGMWIVVEYSGRGGKPQGVKPKPFRISGLPVMDQENHLVGMVTERDFLRETAKGDEELRARTTKWERQSWLNRTIPSALP